MVRLFLGILTLLWLVACSVPEEAKQPDVPGLTRAIATLGPDVDPEEAARAARIAYAYPLQLRRDYGVTDTALVHNTKVNQGRRPRGLCWHWADDLEARLRKENFQTLQLHRAIANSDNLLIEHSTVIVSALGDSMFEGIVLDPWRYGGYLFWSPTLKDTRYKWVDRAEVFEKKRKRKAAQ